MWPTLLHLLQIGNSLVVRRLRVDGTPEFDGRVSGVMNLVRRRTSSRTSLARITWLFCVRFEILNKVVHYL